MNAASCIAAMAFIPARNSSVFLTGCPSFAARNFNTSRISYSALGNVKLSRTILGFFGFSILAAGAFGLAFGVAFGKDLAAVFGATAAFAFGAGFVGIFLLLTTGALTALFGVAGDTGAAGRFAAGATSSLGVMLVLFVNGIYSLYCK